jgi:hypothetical protein
MILGQDFPGHNERLDEIYRVVESAWEGNLKRYKGKPVRYLLIAEAAPWTENGRPNYFYEALKGAWVNRILHTFFSKDRLGTDEEAWSKLADMGFLLIDSLPFARTYTTPFRRGDEYLRLLHVSKDHFYEKLNNPGLILADDLKVALAFIWNGRRVIQAYDGEIELPHGRKIPLNESLIAADRSGYTSSLLLRDIWGLPKPA